jgi:hypothetical protein
MPGPIDPSILDGLERMAVSCGGDVGGLLGSARGLSPAFADDLSFADGIEQAAVRRAAAGDRTGAWALSCAQAMLRSSNVASPQEDAEVCIARVFGELASSPAAHALPEPARWVVSGMPEPPLDANTIELARRNARRHAELLTSELGQRAPALRACLDAGDTTTFETAIGSYVAGAQATRAALARAVDHVVARTSDASLGASGGAALAELDLLALPLLFAQIAEARRLVSSAAAAAAQPAPAAPEAVRRGRPSFAGAAPPMFRSGEVGPVSVPAASGPASANAAAPSSAHVPPPASSHASAPASPEAMRDQLEQQMRVAFERAWSSPGPETRAAFEQAVRARYTLETAGIPDPAEQQRVLEHYVGYALSQLPPG